MFLEILIAIILGCIIGILTGLTPGVHINLVALIVVSISAYLLRFTNPLVIAIFIISVAITHTFLDAIPSIFLGAPDADTVLSVLPGHRMLLEGRGYHAVLLTLIGSLFSIILIVIFAWPVALAVEKTYPTISKFIGIILITSSLFLIIREKKSRFWAFFIFTLAGVLGISTLNMSQLKNPLLPLFSGMFGISGLIISLSEKVKIPKQEISELKISKKKISKAMGSCFVAGNLCSFLPALGPSQAAIIGSQLSKDLGDDGFLILVGGLNTITMGLSVIALYVIDKARNGAIVAVSQLMEKFTITDLIVCLGAMLIVAGISTILTIKITKIFSRIMSKINYQKVCLFIIFLIIILTAVLSGLLGILILIVSTALGIIPPLVGIGRNHLMGSLLLPVILYFI
ncbi:tripartite tricarboxylate transporter permease [Candidatus Woesearchaeota archaeon]|nr:tripartite tricarboxylate transporter permease [Candidatus Woesearchaeota archaeon]